VFDLLKIAGISEIELTNKKTALVIFQILMNPKQLDSTL